jgi:hypothetical protein
VRLARSADWLAAAVAVSLPWSTSATGILIAIWLTRCFRRSMSHCCDANWSPPRRTAGLVVAVARARDAVGAGAFAERLFGWAASTSCSSSRCCLRNSPLGARTLGALRISRLLRRAADRLVDPVRAYAPPWGIILLPNKLPAFRSRTTSRRTPSFRLCFRAARARDRAHARGASLLAVALLALAALFLADIYYVATARTALVVIPLLLAAVRSARVRLEGMAIACLAGAVLFAGLWFTSPFLRMRVLGGIQEISQYRDDNAVSSAGLRLEFWKKSARFIGEAPLLGHGTGSMRDLFSRSTLGRAERAASSRTIRTINISRSRPARAGRHGAADRDVDRAS